jgi:hypothetical protein
METIAKPQAAVSFFPEDERQKKDQGVAQALAPDHALRKVEEPCAIHKSNVTIALSVSDRNRIEKKTGRAS